MPIIITLRDVGLIKINDQFMRLQNSSAQSPDATQSLMRNVIAIIIPKILIQNCMIQGESENQ
jgi:hypothetical protein